LPPLASAARCGPHPLATPVVLSRRLKQNPSSASGRELAGGINLRDTSIAIGRVIRGGCRWSSVETNASSSSRRGRRERATPYHACTGELSLSDRRQLSAATPPYALTARAIVVKRTSLLFLLLSRFRRFTCLLSVFYYKNVNTNVSRNMILMIFFAPFAIRSSKKHTGNAT